MAVEGVPRPPYGVKQRVNLRPLFQGPDLKPPLFKEVEILESITPSNQPSEGISEFPAFVSATFSRYIAEFVLTSLTNR